MKPTSFVPSVEFSCLGTTSQARPRRSPNTIGSYPQHSQRTPLPIGGGRTWVSFNPDVVHAGNFPTIGSAPSFDKSISPFAVGIHNRPDGVNSVSISAPYGQPAAGPHQAGYIGHDSSYSVFSHALSFSTRAAAYLREGFHNAATAVTNMNNSLYPTALSHPGQDFEPGGVDHSLLHSTSSTHSAITLRNENLINLTHGPVAERLDLNTNHRRPITTAVQVNVNATTGQPIAADSTRTLPPSSIPMSNGHSPSAVSPVVPGSSGPRPHHLQFLMGPPPSTVISAPATGNGLEPKVKGTHTTPILPSAPRVIQNDFGPVWSVPQPSHSANIQQTPSNPPREAFLASVGSMESSTETIKKTKKKSKMHACPICTKEFPRPSGLHTHMNTHNNTKPYPCTYPGCHRMFGVRSNAKRHLRTHGISSDTLPYSTSSSPLATTTLGKWSATTSAKDGFAQPYVVSFHEPIIVEDHATREVAAHDSGGEASNNPAGKILGSRSGGGGSGDGGFVPSPEPAGPPFFKLRWLPLSLTSRNNAAALRNARDKEACEDNEDDEDNVEEREGSGEESSSEGRSGWKSRRASSPWRDGSYDEGQGKYKEDANKEDE